jgi:signal transduction histidine kinase
VTDLGVRTQNLSLWSRLSVRFALLLIGMLFLVYMTAGPIRRWGSNIITPLFEGEVAEADLDPEGDDPDPDDEGADEFSSFELMAPTYIDLLHVDTGVDGPDDLSILIHGLIQFAQRDSEGRWTPPPFMAETTDQELGLLGKAYAWLDADRKVIAASDALGLETGQELEPGIAHISGEVADQANEFPEHPMVFSLSAPVVLEGQIAGWFELYTIDPPDPSTYSMLAGAMDIPPEVIDEIIAEYSDEVEATLESLFEERVAAAVLAAQEEDELEMRVGTVLEICLFVFAATISSLILSSLVTKRLRRFVEMVESAAADGELPGPFLAQGRDEVAVLARSMNSMRDKTVTLVQEASDRDVARRRWVAQVSHDLRTPLTALVACLDRARENLEAGTDLEETRTDLRDRLTTAHLDAERVGNLADDLLDIARLDTEKALVLEPVPPGELARQVLTMMRPMAESLERELEPDVAKGLPQLDADGNRLMRGLENLLRNALQHSVRLVVLRVREHDNSIRFEVCDDGAGLPTEPDGSIDLERLAGKLSRSDSAGLGLVVARRVAEAHGGRIGAENHEDGGASVWLDLPLS